MGTNLTKQNSLQEEIKSRLKSENTCYHSVQIPLSSSLLYENIKIKTHRTIILPIVVVVVVVAVVLCVCVCVCVCVKHGLLTLREEGRLRVYENSVLRRIFGPKKNEALREGRKLHNDELNVLHSSPNTIRVMK